MRRPPRPPPTTRTETRRALARRGIDGRAAEAFLTATGPDRHLERVRFFKDAALEEFRHVIGAKAIPLERRAEACAYAIAVLVLDAFGVVGASGPTEASQKNHHRAFREGCGPRLGPMAGATHAAAHDALVELWRLAVLPSPAMQVTSRDGACSPARILVRPSVSPPGIVFSFPSLPDLVLEAEPNEHISAQPPAWLYTIAMEGMRRALDVKPWFALGAERFDGLGVREPSPHILNIILLDGTAEHWTAVVDATLERKRVDQMGRDLARLGRDLVKEEPLFWMPPWKPPSRVGLLSYMVDWIHLVISDEARAARVAESVKADESETVEHEVKTALLLERRWITDARGFAEELIGHDPPQRIRDATVCLVLLAAAAAPGRALAESITSSKRLAVLEPKPIAERCLAYAARATRALVERHGAVVLSPTPGLGLVFETDGDGAELDALSHPRWPNLRMDFLPLVDHVLAELDDGPALPFRLGEVRVIGTLSEWRALAAELRAGAGSSASRAG